MYTHKLDDSKVRWIIRQKRKEKPSTNAEIASTMNISQLDSKLNARFRNTPISETFLGKHGRPKASLPDAESILRTRRCCRQHAGAVRLEKRIEKNTGVHIPHNIIHRL